MKNRNMLEKSITEMLKNVEERVLIVIYYILLKTVKK